MVMAFYKITKGSKLSLGCLFKLKEVFLRSALCSRLSTKVTVQMKTAYFQNIQGEEKVQISIAFDEFNTSQLLQFERNISESLDNFLKRLESKVKDVYHRKVLKKSKKGAPEPLPTCPNFDLFFLANNQPLPNNINLGDFFNNKVSGDLKLRIIESDYDVILNCPIVKSLALPKTLKVSAMAYPEKFVTHSTNEDQTEFMWFRSVTPKKSKSWEKCGEGFYYTLTEEDLGHYLKLVCTPKNLSKVGPTYETVSNNAVEKLENTELIEGRHEFTKEKAADDEVRIVSYNVLADCYTQTKEAKASLFTFCDPKVLDFDYRKCLLNFELCGYNADILCLQEVDKSFYERELLLWFTGLGYNCSFHEKEGSKEGCAFFYHPKKFSALSTEKYVLIDELINNPAFRDISEIINQNENLKARLPNVTSVIQVVVLQSLTVPDQLLVIGNTHFYFHPNACHIRLLQGIVTCKTLLSTVEELLKQEPKKKISVIVCGDFNSTPETSFHKLLLEGHVDENCPDWKSCEGEEIKNLSYKNSLKLESAYKTHQNTNFTPFFKGCLDYIYFQNNHLEVKQTVPVPGEEVLGQYGGGIPSKYFPSDHVALIADFKFKT